MNKYKADLPAFPRCAPNASGRCLWDCQIKEGSAVTTLLYSQDDYIADQTTSNLKVATSSPTTSPTNDIAPSWTILGEIQ